MSGLFPLGQTPRAIVRVLYDPRPKAGKNPAFRSKGAVVGPNVVVAVLDDYARVAFGAAVLDDLAFEIFRMLYHYWSEALQNF
ncbi:MAG: hypothetical protein WCS42_26920 [Verrucomicrobiota bacterium]